MNSEIVSLVEEYVRSELKNVDCSHDWNHIKRVKTNALKILGAEQSQGRFLNSDLTVIEIAALMHDVGDFKYTKDHSAGPRMVKEFLSNHLTFGITQDQIDKISQIVANISFRHELSNGMAKNLPEELLIVQDADRMDAIGAVGVARCFAFNGAMKRPFYTEADSHEFNEDITGDEYNRQAETGSGSAVAHFYEKLFKLKDLMKTETGRKMAEERNEFMIKFIETLRQECDL